MLTISHLIIRNGCDQDLVKEEFQALKIMITVSVMDKSYLGLWDIILSKEPYSDYKVFTPFFIIITFMLLLKAMFTTILSV